MSHKIFERKHQSRLMNPFSFCYFCGQYLEYFLTSKSKEKPHELLQKIPINPFFSMRCLLFINGRGITDLLKDRVGVIILYSHLIYLLLYFTYHIILNKPHIHGFKIL